MEFPQDGFGRDLKDVMVGGLELVVGVAGSLFMFEVGDDILRYSLENGNAYTVGLAVMVDTIGVCGSIGLVVDGAKRMIGYNTSSQNYES